MGLAILEKIKFLWPFHKITIIYVCLWTLFFFILWSQAITIDKSRNVMAGHVGVWGDGPAHFTMGSAMAHRDLILKNSPFLISASFQYPFFVNLISALLIRWGLPFFSAFTIPSFLFCIAGVITLFAFYRQLFQSQKTAVICSLIFLLNGGLGFISNSGNEIMVWKNVVDKMLIPQRSLQLGFPLALLILMIIYQYIYGNTQKKFKWKMCLGGALFGFLPLVHTHSFISLGLILIFWFIDDFLLHKNEAISRRFFYWVLFFFSAIFVFFPILKIFPLFDTRHTDHMKWLPGWYASKLHVNFLWMWLVNWGLTPLAAVFGYYFYRGRKLLIFLPFLLLFIISNLIQFHAWIWDNTKFFFWVSLGVSGLAGYFVSHLWGSSLLFDRINPRGKKWAALILFTIMIFSGAWDCMGVLGASKKKYKLYSAEEMDLSRWVIENTDADSVWLTGTRHNNFLYNLTGRQSLVTYEGWMWSHGYNFKPVLVDANEMFENPSKRDLYAKYQVDYILVGPTERKIIKEVESIMQKKFDLVKKSKNYSIYRIN